MADDKNNYRITLFSQIIGIVAGIFTIISSISLLFGIKNNSLLELFNVNPLPTLIISILILIFLAIRRKMNHGKTDFDKHWHFTSYKKVGFFNDFDMKWDVEMPKSKSTDLINIYNYFDISPNPKCEKCNTKLEYHDNIFWYTYSCFNCSFKKRTWTNLEKLTDRVNENFKIEIEKRIKRKD